MYTYIQNFYYLASLCSYTGWGVCVIPLRKPQKQVFFPTAFKVPNESVCSMTTSSQSKAFQRRYFCCVSLLLLLMSVSGDVSPYVCTDYRLLSDHFLEKSCPLG